MIPPGPVSDHLLAILEELPVYQDYHAGRISHEQYVEGLQACVGLVEKRTGEAERLLRLAALYPPDFDREADAIYSTLVAEGFVAAPPALDAFDAYRERVLACYEHGENHTYIHPDDARLLYFLAMATKPKRMLTVGSYYGYWAVWAMAAVVAGGGEAVLIDPNPAVCALAEKNFRALGFGDRTVVHAAKAEAVFADIAPGIDLALLDAAGSHEHPDPAYHGKGIYGFLIQDIYERMSDGALLVVHNDEVPGTEHRPLEPFHAFCEKHFRKRHVTRTPEGFGVYLK